MAEFLMPSLGADMEAGTLVTWRRGVGDRVERDDVIAEVETQKGIIEVEVFSSGTVERLLVEPGQKVPVGTALAIIREDREAAARPLEATSAPAEPLPPAPAAPAPATPVSAAPAPAAATAAPLAEAPRPPPGEGLRASPRARRRAQELGVNLATLRGTGPGGVIEAADVE
jgi:pyruvate dehydrogenase E2 component (dihydrolipoamide acetyltransferase)